MKRSEMRDLIKQELLKTVGSDAAKYIAEDILHLIESNGMRPPLATISDPGHFPGDSFKYTIGRWEEDYGLEGEENETK